MKSLIDLLDKFSPKGTFTHPENQGYVAGYRDAFDLVRKHGANEHQVVSRLLAIMEEVAAMLWDNRHDPAVWLLSHPAQLAIAVNGARMLRSAIAEIGDGRVTTAPVAAVAVPQAAPASEAYLKVEAALLKNADPRVGTNECIASARQALTVLPALNPTPKDQALQVAVEALTWLCVREVHYDTDVRAAPDLTMDAWKRADAALVQINTILKGNQQ